MARTVLIDADILAFQVASSLEQVFEFNGQHVLHADLNDGIIAVEESIQHIIKMTDSDGASLFLTGTDNYRKEVLPSYKGNRVGTRKPMILGGLRVWMMENTRCFIEDILEGDDLIGIHATMPHKGERVIYSADKDLKTIPGLHWDSDDGEVIEVEEFDADLFFLTQVLTGDPTDNYKGAEGVGAKQATELLNGLQKWVSYEHMFKSGPRKGQTEKRWKKEPCDDLWEIVVSAYKKAGQTEKDALIQARCARILRHGEYDFKTQKVNLWTPH